MTEENKTIFGDPPNQEVKTDTTTTLTLPQELAELVGQGKKYSTVEDALKSVPHAQKHISTLEADMIALKEELSKRKTAQELLDEIKSRDTHTEQPSVTGITEDKAAEIVKQILQKEEQSKKTTANIKSVTSAFAEKFGEKAEAEYNKIAAESGLTVEALNRLSASSPSVVFKLAGLFDKKEETVTGKPNSSVNTEAMRSTANNQTPSARVPAGAKTKDLVAAWKAAGAKVQSQT
jgi:hypothetical protein